MFETGIRQFEMAMAMVRGRRLDTRNLARLVDDVVDTLAEFGEPGAGAQQLLAGPLAAPEARAEFASRNLRRTARRLAAQSPFYNRRFASAELSTGKIDLAALRRIPVTTKGDLVERPRDFLCADVTPHLSTRTTGTTGRPAEIWLSRYEMELWPALGALSSLLRDELRPGDVMQVNISSRATAAMHLTAATCRLAGVACLLLGIVAPDDALDSLGDGAVTVLSTSPSYLGELITAARRRGMGPSDFRLRRVIVGGEVLSRTLAQAARETLGVATVDDVFSMTEVIPVTAKTCSHGHLHHDLNTGLVELLDLQTGEPAAPGALGTVVITPYFPYRDCMPVFRYDTRDVARRLPDDALTCELASVPATSPLLGKVDHLIHLGGGEVVTPRQLIDAIEALPTAPWPARFRATSRCGTVALVLPTAAVEGYGEAAARRHFADAGLEVDLTITHEPPTSLRTTRSDLHEATFAGANVRIGA